MLIGLGFSLLKSPEPSGELASVSPEMEQTQTFFVTTINTAFPNYRQLAVPEQLTIQLNPFHGIVGRDIASILAPNLSNGYLITAFPE